MALIKCHECGNEVSSTAKACPKCGAPVKDRIDPDAIKGLAFLAAIGIIWALISTSCSDDTEPAKEPPKAEAKAPTDEPVKEPPPCESDDLQCLGDKGTITAGLYCADKVERFAKHSVKWTDGWFEPKFSRFRWRNMEKGEITYIGDKAMFQNGFGAMQNVIYECDIAADKETVLDVRVRNGKL